jgi:phytoene synthase
MPVDHYENFPVASFLLPAHLREPVEAIYAFARSADDIADEGDAQPIVRLARLNDYRRALHAIEQNKAFDDPTLAPVFDRLGHNIRQFELPVGLFRDLLDAFSQDVGKTRYADFAELSDYCRRSANPVGRLLLHLYGVTDALALQRSDAICSALQLINFWQDGCRLAAAHLPAAGRHGTLRRRRGLHCRRPGDRPFSALMDFEIQRARTMMLHGAPLARRLPGRIGWELRLVVQGGLAVLDKIEAEAYDVFNHRPVLGKGDMLRLAWRALVR